MAKSDHPLYYSQSHAPWLLAGTAARTDSPRKQLGVCFCGCPANQQDHKTYQQQSKGISDSEQAVGWERMADIGPKTIIQNDPVHSSKQHC